MTIPFLPITSGIPPTFDVITAVPLLIASAITKPKGSSHVEGTTIKEARFINFCTS